MSADDWWDDATDEPTSAHEALGGGIGEVYDRQGVVLDRLFTKLQQAFPRFTVPGPGAAREAWRLAFGGTDPAVLDRAVLVCAGRRAQAPTIPAMKDALAEAQRQLHREASEHGGVSTRAASPTTRTFCATCQMPIPVMQIARAPDDSFAARFVICGCSAPMVPGHTVTVTIADLAKAGISPVTLSAASRDAGEAMLPPQWTPPPRTDQPGRHQRITTTPRPDATHAHP